MPVASICHGVHKPCPKNIFETNILIIPIIKPRSAPTYTEKSIIIARNGLK